jgi:glycosyltransferase involved in cell wall biosynthesis
VEEQRVRRHFANGHTTYRRLFDASSWWRSVGFRALHHPPALSGFTVPKGQDYVLMPGRLHRWKRVHLIIEAYRHLKRDVPLLITGTGEDEASLRALARGDRRIRFLGAVKDADLVELYANALVVPFVPRHEDYGLVTIEAFKSGKPVLTCTDSGETIEFVRDGENGYVVEPDPKAIAKRLRDAIDHRRQAVRLGLRGLESVSTISWEPIVEAYLPRQSGANAVWKRRTSPRVGVLRVRLVRPDSVMRHGGRPRP